MPVVRLPLVGSAQHRHWDDANTIPAVSTIDQKFVNVYFRKDVNPETGISRILACKRPGIEGALGGPATIATGAYSMVSGLQFNANDGADCVAIYPSTTADNVRAVCWLNSSTTVSANMSVPDHSGATRPLRFFDSSGNAQIAVMITQDGSPDAVNAFLIQVNDLTDLAFTPAEITDAEFPDDSAIGSFVWKDGYLFVMTSNGLIYNSDLNAPTSWSSTGFVSTQARDGGRGVALYKDQIVAFGTDYIEFYRNAGNPAGSPLDRVIGATITGYGIEGRRLPTVAVREGSYHYLSANDTVYWVNSARTHGGKGIFMLDGYRPRKISSPAVDYDLWRVADQDIRIQNVICLHGYNYLIISTGNQSTDYVWAYNLETGIWSTWQSALFADTLGGFCVGLRSSSDQNVSVLSGTSKYEFDVNSALSTDISYTDNSVAVAMTIQTRPLDFGTNKKKRLNRITVIGSDSRETSTTGISWSDDDGQTFSTAQNVDMNDARPTLTRLGTFRKRQFRITNSVDAPFEAEALEFDYDVLTS